VGGFGVNITPKSRANIENQRGRSRK